MRLAGIGHDVWVGDVSACKARVKEFPLSVHVHSRDNHSRGLACRGVLADRRANKGSIPRDGLCVTWSELEPISRMEPGIDKVAAYCAIEGRLFVHCHGGAIRSPAVAVVALAARGLDPFDAMGCVARGVYGYADNRHKTILPDFTTPGMLDIVAWALAARASGKLRVR